MRLDLTKEEQAELLEIFARIEHQQWEEWSRTIEGDVDIGPERRMRWRKCWVPYEQLSEEMKEEDRKWGRRVMWNIKDFLSRVEVQRIELKRQERLNNG